MNTFIGVDLGWYGKPSGLASICLEGSALRLRNIARLESADEIFGWVQAEVGSGGAVVGVDAPLVIPNETGIRRAERGLNADFRRFHAGCHAANLGRPFSQNVISFSRRLEAMGFPRCGARSATGRAIPNRGPSARGDRQPVRARPDREVQARHTRRTSARAPPSSHAGAYAPARTRSGFAFTSSGRAG